MKSGSIIPAMKLSLSFPVLAVLVALLACKKKEEEEQPLPAPLPVPDGPTTATPPTDTPGAPSKTDDTPTPTTKWTKPKDAGVKDAGTTTKADAGTTGPSAACFQQCQTALSTCLTPQPGKDGGLPKLADPKQCQDAFTACQTACK